MPTYEYRCPAGHDFEQFYRKISDAGAAVACPTCGQVGERRMSSGGGLLFKGSGFYITDYGKDGKKPQGVPTASAEGGKGGEGAATGGESTATETKSSDSKPSESKPSESKQSESKSSESKSSESKPSDTKSSSAKASESRSSGSGSKRSGSSNSE